MTTQRYIYIGENTGYVFATYWEAVNSASGSITIPAGSTIKLDAFQDLEDAVVSTITNGLPDFNAADDGGGNRVVATFDSGGNYTLSPEPSSYPVALVFRVIIPESNIDWNSDNLILEDVHRVGGTGDVDGPASSTDNALVRFDGTTGKLIQNSNVSVDDTGNMGGVGTISSGEITSSSLTASRALVSGTSKEVQSSSVTSTELGYVSGVTSAIQTQLNTKAPTASPTFSGTITTPLTASKALTTGASSELAVSATTSTELGYVSGVTSAIQTQLNAKAPTASPTFSGTITTPLTASRALTTGASNELAVSSVTSTELGYVSGVTSSIQTQLNSKGVGDMTLSGVQTITGAKTFGTIGGSVGKLILAGSTSGSSILNAAAVAGSTTLTLPGITGTLVGTGDTGTVTNTMLAGSIDVTTKLTGAVPIANGGTNNASLAVTAGGTLYTDGTKLVNVGAGTSGQYLKSNASSAPTWATLGSNYRPVRAFASSHIAGKVAGTYALGWGDAAAVSGTGTLYPQALIRIDSADYASINGSTVQFRIKAQCLVNDTAPTGNFTFGLYPVTRPASSGGTGVLILTLGTVVAGTNGASFTTPAADSMATATSSAFNLPADGWYSIGVVTTQTVATNSLVWLYATLEVVNA